MNKYNSSTHTHTKAMKVSVRKRKISNGIQQCFNGRNGNKMDSSRTKKKLHQMIKRQGYFGKMYNLN